MPKKTKRSSRANLPRQRTPSTESRRAHLCLVQPPGYVHSLALQDPLEYFADQLQRTGVTVTTGVNQVDREAVNYVFGAHLGFDEAIAEICDCVIVNLEQLGAGGAAVSAQYLHLLRRFEALDYDPANVTCYRDDTSSVPVLRFGFDAGRAARTPLVPLAERPAGLVFIGSMVERRARLIERISACGVPVTVPVAPLYGAERDALVSRASAVVNLAAYETTRFEQVRASLVMSLGTPLVSERRTAPGSHAHHFEEAVHWFDVDDLEHWFSQVYGTDAFWIAAEQNLARFRASDVTSDAVRAWKHHVSRLGVRRRPHGASGLR